MYEDPFCIAKNRNYYTEENTRRIRIVKWDEKSPPVYIIINDDSFDKSRRLINQTRTDFQYILVSITHKSARQISQVAHVPINPRTHTHAPILYFHLPIKYAARYRFTWHRLLLPSPSPRIKSLRRIHTQYTCERAYFFPRHAHASSRTATIKEPKSRNHVHRRVHTHRSPVGPSPIPSSSYTS